MTTFTLPTYLPTYCTSIRTLLCLIPCPHFLVSTWRRGCATKQSTTRRFDLVSSSLDFLSFVEEKDDHREMSWMRLADRSPTPKDLKRSPSDSSNPTALGQQSTLRFLVWLRLIVKVERPLDPHYWLSHLSSKQCRSARRRRLPCYYQERALGSGIEKGLRKKVRAGAGTRYDTRSSNYKEQGPILLSSRAGK